MLSTCELLRRAGPIMPVLTIAQVEHAVPLATALAAAGCRVVEVTLRTPAATAAIAAIRAALPALTVGAGTVVDHRSLQEAAAAGAQFAVSPGFSSALMFAAAERHLCLLPGMMTPSDMMQALAHGCESVKLFPALPMGGAAWLRALAGPFPQLRFCPTGGVGADNYRELLALDNVTCVGGSWFIDSAALRNRRWDDIEAAARSALQAVAPGTVPDN
jgi:2-dehydro-3-deoxyphosphogluconate aldolase/(4S)-4-hydroxy-2-oxoglutarate aldolase